MAFVPNGTIKLLAGVPLDNSYTHTVKYASAGAQTAAFAAKVKRTYEHCTYIRETNRIRIPDVYDDVVMCNYLMYQNQGYGNNKWFYAFITGVYYVNDHATEIEFELDVMQTWAFDYTILPGFIERNHTATDAIGDFLLPEPVNTGELVITQETSSGLGLFDEWDIVAYSTFEWGTWTIPANVGDLTGNVFSGLVRTRLGKIRLSQGSSGDFYSGFAVDPRPALSNLINNHANLVDGLVALIMTPSKLEDGTHKTLTITKPTAGNPLMGYVPRNNKLYTGQFLKLFLTDGSGSGKWLQYEDFLDPTTAEFRIFTDLAPNQSVICVPMGYGRRTTGIPNFQEAIVMTGFPTCAWVSDVFKTYMAQNAASVNLACATAALTAVMGATTAIVSDGAAGTNQMIGGIESVLGTMAKMEDMKKQPPNMHGSISNTALMAVAEKAFKAIAYVPKPEYLAAIDDFFDMYGYQINRVGVPNTDVRPYWCYARMKNAAISPSGIDGLPASDMRKIETVLNTGVTFWKDMANVGNYSLNNSV